MLFLKYLLALSPKRPSAKFIRNGEVSALDLRVLRTNGPCWVDRRINKPRLTRTRWRKRAPEESGVHAGSRIQHEADFCASAACT